MARYIDMDKIFPNGVFYVCENNPMASLDELINRICNTPTADVVEVVRCKDCKHFGKNKIYRANPKLPFSFCEKFHHNITTENDYCSCGERKCEDNE